MAKKDDGLPNDGKTWFTISGKDLAAIKKADRLEFATLNGAATLTAIKAYMLADDPFADDAAKDKEPVERKRTIVAAAQPIPQKPGSKATKPREATFTVARGNPFWKGALRQIREGYTCSLRWIPARSDQTDDGFAILVKRSHPKAKPVQFLLGHGELVG